ncbi:MAG: four helix bundle protein [Bacteroidales bacterium]|jgi:four helix bundle protein|nr:four helix bundle protein [Bacteroidales bacterium]
MEKRNEIVEVSFRLALLIIEFSEELESNKKYVIAKQVLRSGTSIGAYIRESQSAESKSDFIHKLKIAHKEVLETEYWIDLIKESKTYPKPTQEIENLLLSVNKLLNKIISTSKNKIK